MTDKTTITHLLGVQSHWNKLNNDIVKGANSMCQIQKRKISIQMT